MVVKVQAESLRRPLRAVSELLILVGFAGMLVWAWEMFETRLYQHVQKSQFERELSDLRKAAVADTAPPLKSLPDRPESHEAGIARFASTAWFKRDPLVLGLIEVPRLDLSVIVREGMDDATLSKAAGHVPASALPGEPGNFVVLGHRDTLFRPLRELERGDRVRVRTVAGDFRYSVDSVEVVPPEGVDLRYRGPEPGITLVTCYPFDFVGSAPRRFVAHGHLEGAPPVAREGAERGTQ